MPLLPSVTLSIKDQLLALRSSSGARVLDELALLSVRGNDRVSWLNGAITNDVKKLSVGQSAYAAVVTVKGRILTDLFVYVRPDDILLSVPRSLIAELCAHLERYIVMEDVTLAPAELSVVSVQGPSADIATQSLEGRFRAERLGATGFDVITAPDHPEFGLASVSEDSWERARIIAGVPAFGRDFDATNFVQEAAITARAVSFNKGCYLGQEMVCRLEMRGHVQKLLVGLTLQGEARRGDPVLSGETAVGSITSAVVELAHGAVTETVTAAIAMVKYGPVDKRAALTVNGAPAVMKLLG